MSARKKSNARRSHPGKLALLAERNTLSTRASRSRAGLLDRANAFAALGNLAASLCAYVVVGRPCDMLAAKHNIVDARAARDSNPQAPTAALQLTHSL